MNPAHALLALGMLISGSLNTLSASWADDQSAVGSWNPATIWDKMNGDNKATTSMNHSFNHPFFQALGMFAGEFLCMLAYLATRKAASNDPNIVVPGGRTKGAFWFALPAMLDITGTGIMYCGLCLSYASVFQMLRGSCVVFTCIFSTVFLKRKIWGFQWISVVLIVVGVLIVGVVSVTHQQHTANKSQAGVLIGDCLIVLAQVATATQMTLEEVLMSRYPTPALKVVGLEGIFGFSFLSILLFIMFFIRFDGLPVENVPDGMTQVSNNGLIGLAIVANAFSIAFFNFFGISVTQQLSAAHRMVLDSVRTLLVSICSWTFMGEPFLPLQLIGFAILLLGTATYNALIKIPGMPYPPPPIEDDPNLLEGRGRTLSELPQRQSSSIIEGLVKEESNAKSTSFTRM